MYLYDAIKQKIPVIGVTKNRFKQANFAQKVFSGQSKKPLYVTSAGMSQLEAAGEIEAMAGSFRIPDLLKAVDEKTHERQKQHI